MARRRFSDQMQSSAALWSRRIAAFALIVAALSVVVIRSELLEIGPSLATFAAALAFAVFAILLGIVALIAIWRQGLNGLGSALLGIVLAAALLPYPAYLAYRNYKQPSVPDVTTDTADPPRYDVIARLRERGSNDFSAAKVQAQKAAVPDLAPLQVSSPPAVVYNAALDVVTKRKWRVVDARPPVAGRRDGIVEAVARSPVMGFRDYVVIRVRASGKDTRVDARSAARYPFLDLGGENATRVRVLLEDIDEASSTAQARLDREAERNAERAAEKNATTQKPAQRKR